LHGVPVIEEGIADNPKNHTRFVVLSREIPSRLAPARPRLSRTCATRAARSPRSSARSRPAG
ncbi:MAG: hypothetical protein EB824_00965, partial [Thaumarchaeota archaeon S15]